MSHPLLHWPAPALPPALAQAQCLVQRLLLAEGFRHRFYPIYCDSYRADRSQQFWRAVEANRDRLWMGYNALRRGDPRRMQQVIDTLRYFERYPQLEYPQGLPKSDVFTTYDERNRRKNDCF